MGRRVHLRAMGCRRAAPIPPGGARRGVTRPILPLERVSLVRLGSDSAAGRRGALVATAPG
jgi:hypothetical protein